jgi:hypothetical protein
MNEAVNDPSHNPSPARPRHRMTLALVIALLLVAALCLLAARARAWSDAGDTGSVIAPGISPMPLLAAAGVAAVLATSGRLRVAVGALLLLIAVAVGLDMVRSLATLDTPVSWWPWPSVAFIGLMAMALAGVLTIVTSRHWSGLSSRYSREQHSREDSADSGDRVPDARDQWRALDEGRDPTA